MSRLVLTRTQILAFRRRAGALDERLPAGARSLRRAAWAGLQDSMPRAALLSIHARVAGTKAAAWEHPSLAQIWGPRYNVFVVAERDRALFTLGRLPDAAAGRHRAETAAERLNALLGDTRMTYGAAGRALGVHPNSLRYGATTGTIALRWDGARLPVVWAVPRPSIDPLDARVELARRYLHIFGPGTSSAFAKWAGVHARSATAAFDVLRASLTPVRTPIRDAWVLAEDEAAFRAEAWRRRAGPAVTERRRLLPAVRIRSRTAGARYRTTQRTVDIACLAGRSTR